VDIELLRTFLTVSQARHFGRAADQLFLTPAAVSARIRQLEQTLGVSLFHRTRGNIRLTEEGERLLPHAQKLQDAWAAAQRDLSLKPQSAPAIRIGCPPGLWHWLKPLLEKLQQIEDLQLTLETCSARDIHQHIVQQRLDVGLLLEAPLHDELRTASVEEKTLRLYRSPTSDESGKTGFIQLDWGAIISSQLQHLAMPASDYTIYANDPAIALQRMQIAQCMAWLPEDLLPPTGNPGHLVAEFEQLKLPVYIAYRSSASNNPLLQDLLENSQA
jgi:DNA-binding transcriptional LysR family regulator